MNGEHSQRREQATPEEIERFLDLAHTPVKGDSAYTYGRTFLINTIGIRGMDDGHAYVRNASSDRALSHLYSEIYPGTTERERYVIAWLDVAAIARTHYLLWDSDNDPSEHMFRADKQLLDEATHGMMANDVKHHFTIRQDILRESPPCRQRLEQGMPRIMQLFVATQAVDRLQNIPDWRHRHANALYYLPELWDLSDEEAKVVTQLAAEYGSDYGANILSLMTADERLLERYREQDDTLDIDSYGGNEALLKTARHALKEFVRWGQDSKYGTEWLELDAALEDQLAEVFPYEERRELAFEAWFKRPGKPDEALQTYITLSEIGKLSKQYIQEQISRSDNRELERHEIGRRRVATEMEFPQTIIDGATYWDHKDIFALIENHAAAEDSESREFADRYRRAAEYVDEELAVYLDDYAAVIRSGDLVWPVEGWSGAPEEEEAVRYLSDNQDKARQKLRQAESAARHKVLADQNLAG